MFSIFVKKKTKKIYIYMTGTPTASTLAERVAVLCLVLISFVILLWLSSITLSDICQLEQKLNP